MDKTNGKVAELKDLVERSFALVNTPQGRDQVRAEAAALVVGLRGWDLASLRDLVRQAGVPGARASKAALLRLVGLKATEVVRAAESIDV